MTKWEYTSRNFVYFEESNNILKEMGQAGWEAWREGAKTIFFKRPIEEEIDPDRIPNSFPQPDRVVIDYQGEAVPSSRAKGAGVFMGAIFIRKDGWSLGAPLNLMDVAESLWEDEWVAVIHKGNIMPYTTYKENKK